jgi:hypothetical protein
MGLLDLFKRKKSGTASPSSDSESGDWIDWFLNREGPAGRFRGSRRPRYDIDYLFNGGGSVQSGPRTRQKLEPRGIEALLNATQGRTNREQNRWEGTGGQGPFPVWNQPNPDERRHSLDTMSPGWLQASAPNNSGVMAAMTDNPMVQTAKGFYEQIDPWLPSMDFGERKLGFDFERPIFGGTLGYGMDYDWDDENIGAYAKYVIGLGG